MNTELQSRVDEIRANLDSQREERRIVTLDHCEVELVEERDAGDGADEKLIFQGHAAVFDSWSENLGGFREKIQRGAFRKVLQTNPDVRFLLNHNEDFPMARSTVASGPGSLELREDTKGLRTYAELAPTSTAKDLRILTKTGVVTQMSFGFSMRNGGSDTWAEGEDGMLERTIVSFGGLFDVSPVTYPAYTATDAGMRSIRGVSLFGDDVDAEALRALAWKIHRDEIEVSVEERAAIDAALSTLDTVSPWTAQRALRALALEPELLGAVRGQRATVVLEAIPQDSDDAAWRLAARQRSLRLRELELNLRTDPAT